MTGHVAETPEVTVPTAAAADWVGHASMATLEEVERLVVTDDARVRR